MRFRSQTSWSRNIEPTGGVPWARPLMLWNHCWKLVCQLRSACARTRTFLWMALCLAGMTTRKGLLGAPQHRAGPGARAGLLRQAPGLARQPGPGSKQAHPRLVRSGLPAPPRHPARERPVRPRRERHPGRQVRTQDARGQEAPSTIRVKHQAGVHLRPLLPGGRRADPSLVQRVRLASGLPHPRRRGVFQPRPANAAGQDGPADRLTGPKGAVLLRGRRLLCHRQHRSRVAGPGKPLGHAGQEQQRSFLPGNTPAAEPEAAQGQACKVREKDQGRSAVERERPAPGGPRPRGHPASMARRG